VYENSKRQLTWPNGAKSLLFSAEEPDRLRGPQHYKLWIDELMAMANPEALWDQAMFGLRLGANPQAVVTTTPRPSKFLKTLMSSPTTYLTRATTYENRANLASAFLGEIITKYEGTRLGRQELNAELLDDNPGALWKLSQIDADRVDSATFWASIFPKLRRVVGGLDPSGSSHEKSDECGIVFAGCDAQHPPHFYVFDDRSCIDTPDGWARTAVAAYHQHKADRIVAEGNFGGDMVEAVLRHVDRNVSFKKVTASRGKIVRAEPVAAVYEQHRVHHVGTFPQLEDQMCEYDPALSVGSPDRMDALVWAMTELGVGGLHGLITLWMLKAAELKQKPQAEIAFEPPTNPIVRPQIVSRAPCAACGSETISFAGTFRDPPITRCTSCGLEGITGEVEARTKLLARRREEARSDSRLFKL
jgi:phage terminase large subunit-like protein